MSIVVLLGTAPVLAAETITPVSMTTPTGVHADAPTPTEAVSAETSARPDSPSIMSLPSLATIQAVVNGRRLVPASR